MTGASEVLVVGEALVDVVRSAAGDETRLPGGGPTNVAVGLARLGVATELLTSIAADDDGLRILSHLVAAGVRPLPGSLSAKQTPTAVATLDQAGQSTYRFDVSWALPTASAVQIPSVLHVGSYSAFKAPGAETVRQIALRASSGGALVTFDPNIRPSLIGSRKTARDQFEEIASSATVVKLSDEDASWLYPDIDVESLVARLRALGVTLIVMTLGAEGSLLATSADKVRVPIESTNVVDTIGAGDSYMAALIQCVLYADLRELDVGDLQWIGKRAATAAAITVSRPGADPPWLPELTARLVTPSAPDHGPFSARVGSINEAPITRYVERVRLSSDMRVIAIAWVGGEVVAEEAAQQIHHRTTIYAVQLPDGRSTNVEVVYGPHGPSLFASSRGKRNLLPDLPQIE